MPFLEPDQIHRQQQQQQQPGQRRDHLDTETQRDVRLRVALTLRAAQCVSSPSCRAPRRPQVRSACQPATA